MHDDRNIHTILHVDFYDRMVEYLMSGFVMVQVLAAS